MLKEGVAYDYGTPAADIVKPADPTKAATKEFTYTFAGWEPAIGDVTGDVTYKATYLATRNKYSVKFVDEDGTTILKAPKEYEYGTAAANIEKPADPTKAATAEFTYTFAGWSPVIEDVTEDAVYTATYTPAKNKYKVKFVDEDGTTVLKPETEYEYGTTAADIVKPADPVKAATEEFTYTFAGWSPAIEDVTNDAVYTATYTSTKNKYKVKFVDEDGTTVLKAETEYEYGTLAADIVKPADPTKAATPEFTYTFLGWSPAVADVTKDAVYKAVYGSVTNKYKVKFVDEDGTTVLKAETEYDYGTLAADIVKPADPTKAATPEFTYTFAGWSPAVDTVTGNVTYTAIYSAVKNKYKVKFVDENGTTVLKDETEYEYGTAAADIEKPADPTKAATAEFTYTFAGWSPALAEVTGDAVYTATYTPVKNKYKVKFVDEDGTTVLKAEAEYEYGTLAADIEKPVDPTKTATAEFTYTFAGWSPAIEDVTENAVYKATYRSTRNKYKVKFVDEDGTTVLKEEKEYVYGTAYADIDKPADPTKAKTDEYTYTFTGWTPAAGPVTGNVVYKAVYSSVKNKYKVKFVDEDETTVLKAEKEYEYGTAAADIEKPANPTKAATAENTYVFAGWSPAIVNVTGDAVYKATYTPTKNKYSVKFVDEDGVTVLKAAKDYEYGTAAADIEKPVNPTKAATAEFTYTFAGWSPAVEEVTCDAIYMATYSAVKNKYKVKFVDEDGTTVLKAEKEYEYGTAAADIEKPNDPTKAATKEYTYTFAGWSPSVDTVTKDVTYTATYSAVKNKYKVKFVDEDGTTVLKAEKEYEYGTVAADIEKPANPTKAATAENTYVFAGWSPAIVNVTGDAVYKATYTPSKNKYSVKFVDEDGVSVLKAAKEYDYGTAAADIEKPVNPTKAATAEFTYTFAGWSPAVEEVTCDAIYMATYSAVKNKYKVKFVDEDGTTVLKDETEYEYGTAASDIVEPDVPSKAGTDEWSYVFDGWSPALAEVTGDAVYTATYSPVKNKYKLSFDLNGGTLDGKTGIIVIEAEAGTEIIIPLAPTREGYKFKFWKGSEYYPGDKYLVEGDHTFIAEWEGVKTDEPKKEEPKKEVKKTKVTGDSTNIIILFTLLIISFLGIILIIRKKENS
ncbi:MAG: InlB B-repeat-containing protein [Eubacterium sp.]|nr:InlB B-repeat-containing protein [Eubacterium sp.]